MVRIICYHFWSIGWYLFKKVSKCYHFRVFSFILCCHLMLSFFDVIIWCYHLGLSFDVIIFVLSFFLVQDGCYHLCYHLLLSFFVIISLLFSFSWKRDKLWRSQILLRIFLLSNLITQSFIFKEVLKGLSHERKSSRHLDPDPVG